MLINICVCTAMTYLYYRVRSPFGTYIMISESRVRTVEIIIRLVIFSPTARYTTHICHESVAHYTFILYIYICIIICARRAFRAKGKVTLAKKLKQKNCNADGRNRFSNHDTLAQVLVFNCATDRFQLISNNNISFDTACICKVYLN